MKRSIILKVSISVLFLLAFFVTLHIVDNARSNNEIEIITEPALDYIEEEDTTPHEYDELLLIKMQKRSSRNNMTTTTEETTKEVVYTEKVHTSIAYAAEVKTTEHKTTEPQTEEISSTNTEETASEVETDKDVEVTETTESEVTEVEDDEEDDEYFCVYSPSYFKRAGRIWWGDWSWTWYSERVLPGYGLRIPGRYTDDLGYVRDENGYLCLASDVLSKGTVIDTPFGSPGKVYDCGCGNNYTVDVYVGW